MQGLFAEAMREMSDVDSDRTGHTIVISCRPLLFDGSFVPDAFHRFSSAAIKGLTGYPSREFAADVC